jgi:hypothetical protein
VPCGAAAPWLQNGIDVLREECRTKEPDETDDD